jgi:serine/threonine-protein kinase
MDTRDVFGKTAEIPSHPELRADDRALLPAPGDVILDGKYRIEKILGVGGMGAVMMATHVALGQKAAFKFLLPGVARDHPEAGERFLREARAVCNVRGDHVVRVVDVGRLDGGTPYMLMEYLEGSDLADHLEGSGALPIAPAVDIVLEACEAIAEAHAAGIVHRDLKPSNLFLARRPDGSSTVKVLDFGISKNLAAEGSGIRDTLTRPGAVLGSPMYMSPEQIRGSRSVDARADVWALGVILHELVTGAPMFSGETYSAICAAVASDPPTPLRRVMPGAPDALEDAILRCVEKAPERRFQSVAELARAIAPFGGPVAAAGAERVARLLRAGDVTLPAPRPSSSGRVAASSTVSGTTAPVRRPPVAALPLVALVVVAGALGVHWMSRATSAPAPPTGSARPPAATTTSAAAPSQAPTEPPAVAAPGPVPSASPSPAVAPVPARPAPQAWARATSKPIAPPSAASARPSPTAPAAPSRSESELLDHRL